MPSLDTFQREFADALHGAAAAGRLASQPAFAVYRNTVRKGCVDALEANFPAVVRLVGAEWFRSVADDYATRHPPQDPRLVAYGDGFDRFLASLEAAADLPYLADVARLDRDWVESHTAAEAAPLDAAALAAMDPARLAALHLRPHPAARWRWHPQQPSQAIWSCNRGSPEPAATDIAWVADGSLVTRPHHAVVWCPAPHIACLLLDRCAAGDPLGVAADAALAAEPDGDVAAALALLIGQGAFVHPAPSNGDLDP